MNNSSSKRTGLGFCSALALVFIVLKLLSISPVSEWSWLWVLSPLWIGLALGLLLLGILWVVFNKMN